MITPRDMHRRRAFAVRENHAGPADDQHQRTTSGHALEPVSLAELREQVRRHAASILGGRAHVVDRRDLAQRASLASAVDAPAASAPRSRASRTTVGATLPNAMRGVVPATPATTIFEIACAARVPTLRNHCVPSTGGTSIADDQLVGPHRPSPIAGIELVNGTSRVAFALRARRPRRRRPAPAASRRPATRSRLLPPIVPRFWICGPPTCAPLTSIGTPGRAATESYVGVGRQRADPSRPPRRSNAAQLVQRHRFRNSRRLQRAEVERRRRDRCSRRSASAVLRRAASRSASRSDRGRATADGG